MAAIFKDLQYFSLQLKRAGIIHALGGSGLLRLRGIDVPVNDWDITTDAEEAVMRFVTCTTKLDLLLQNQNRLG